jgi:hypothetical protein
MTRAEDLGNPVVRGFQRWKTKPPPLPGCERQNSTVRLTDWKVEVNHAVKEIGLSFNADAVLARPTRTSEVRLFRLDHGTMTEARLVKEVWDYERYAGHRVWEGARGSIGRTFPFWSRHRYTR